MLLPGAKVLLIGPPGTGKTTALHTLEAAGLKVRAIFADQKFAVATSRAPGLKWRYIPPAKASFSSLAKLATTIHNATYEQLCNMKAGVERAGMTQFLDVVNQCNKFVTNEGENLGPIEAWGTDTVFVFDPLTSLNRMSRDLTVGMKPALSQGEWGVAMANELRLIEAWAEDLFCHVVIIAHVEREMDEVSGGTKIMPSVLGRKLAPVLPGKFTDVILSSREGDSFYWTTADSRADLIGVNLPISGKLQPDFRQLLEGWKRRGGQITDKVPEEWRKVQPQ